MLGSLLIRAAMLAARPFYGGIGAIHVLHRVVPEPERARLDNRALEITPGDLDAILGWMKEQAYDFITLDQVPGRLGKPGRRKFVCFTFDDGYRDNLRNALPIFERYGIPFTVNITTAYSDHTDFPWWYALEDLLCSKDQFIFSYEGRRHGFSLGTEGEKLAAFESISQAIRSCGPERHEELIDDIFEEAPSDLLRRARDLIMDWDEVAILDRHPLVTMGSHGVHHLTSSRLDSVALKQELAGSKRILEQRLGHPVRHLAYPFGGVQAVGAREFQCARECGYATAVTTRCANLFPPHSAALDRLPRLGVSGNYPAIPRLERLESGLACARANQWKRVVTD
jgi:peptidoglycan/xylan/chitin deacetylase (PgdA/CDA1 family)